MLCVCCFAVIGHRSKSVVQALKSQRFYRFTHLLTQFNMVDELEFLYFGDVERLSEILEAQVGTSSYVLPIRGNTRSGQRVLLCFAYAVLDARALLCRSPRST